MERDGHCYYLIECGFQVMFPLFDFISNISNPNTVIVLTEILFEVTHVIAASQNCQLDFEGMNERVMFTKE